MEKYFYFLKNPFSFKGRFNQNQYFICLILTAIYSFISILAVWLVIIEGDNYPVPNELTIAEKNFYDASEIYYQDNTNNTKIYEDFLIKQDLLDTEKLTYRKDRENLLILIIIIINLPAVFFLIASGTKRSHDFGDSGILQIFLPFYILFLLYKNSENGTNVYGENPTDIKAHNNQLKQTTPHVQEPVNANIKIPDKCPHCKNPNTKKIRLCEWCGNQII